MCGIEEMIHKLEGRPEIYIGKENSNTEELYIFLNGFYVGKNISGIVSEIELSFYRNFSRYVYEWMDKNNRLINKEFSFCWYKFFDVFEEEGISLFYEVCKKFFFEYRSNNLDEKYYMVDVQE